ncbi:MAG: hypothetical protein FWE03_02175 [Firmicutes bacterium]|nr:hypothetical protein [Bacillota bacterium]
MSKRLLKGCSLSILFIILFLVAIVPANHFNNGSSFLVQTETIATEASLIINRNFLGGLISNKQPAQKTTHLGGFPIAVSLQTDGVIIEQITQVATAYGNITPASALKQGDFLIELNGQRVIQSGDIERILENLNEENKNKTLSTNFNTKRDDYLGMILDQFISERNKERQNFSSLGKVSAIVYRQGEKRAFELIPVLEELSGKFRLGLVVRDYIMGIGMVSFINEDGSFGALGHPIADNLAGVVPIRGGQVFNCEEVSIIKGEKGKAGEFRVRINSMKNPIGVIEKNTTNGIFGKFNDFNQTMRRFHNGKNLNLFEVTPRKNVKLGTAYICTTIGGLTDFYKIEIIRTINQSNNTDKGIIFRVVDKRLLDKTGGVIQGMSGSPIIQNGAIVGAVTHVFINDPTKGYGLYMEFMSA